MPVERLALDGDPVALAREIRAKVPPGNSVAQAVGHVLEHVRRRGDEAVREFVERFERTTGELRVTDAELARALQELDEDVRAALDLARENVAAVARAGLDEDRAVDLPQGQTVVLREVPVRRAGIYVPGGRAPYPSTVLMGVLTAQAAGVEEIVVCAPGGHPVILAACALCGVEEVWRIGGSQAIGALAYGTETIRAVDVIAGPGSLYVQEAKRQVSGVVGIDGFAGPSDLAILADGEVPAGWVSADLLGQAEHGEDSLTVLVSDDAALLDAVDAEDAPGPCVLVQVGSLEEDGLALVDALAPEHLQLMGSRSEALAGAIRSAGCVFVGAAAGTAFGDYVAGSNHTLPTEGAARFASGLNVRHFRRRMAEVHIPQHAAAALASAGSALARAESFVAHAHSMELRDNGR